MSAAESPAESIYFAALSRESPQERASYLDQACGADADLRRRVERLLQAQPKVGSFLQDVADVPRGTVAQAGECETAGAAIGPYKLLEQIGEGGMGTVWMAEQTEPVKRLVAVKLIKAGMDSRAVIARFEAERQALALMDHANIARVLDAGTTHGEPGGVSPGRPYFVMDLVRGVPITRYCDEHHFTQVDEAIVALRKAIELDPKNAQAHDNLGVALRQQKKLDEAVAAHRKAIEVDPKYAPAHHNLGATLYYQQKLDEAIAEYGKAIELNPKSAPAHNDLGMALVEQGNTGTILNDD
jgi:tetratricopeptide (TPR) repeat protein